MQANLKSFASAVSLQWQIVKTEAIILLLLWDLNPAGVLLLLYWGLDP